MTNFADTAKDFLFLAENTGGEGSPERRAEIESYPPLQC
jgi:hypothetical protein